MIDPRPNTRAMSSKNAANAALNNDSGWKFRLTTSAPLSPFSDEDCKRIDDAVALNANEVEVCENIVVSHDDKQNGAGNANGNDDEDVVEEGVRLLPTSFSSPNPTIRHMAELCSNGVTITPLSGNNTDSNANSNTNSKAAIADDSWEQGNDGWTFSCASSPSQWNVVGNTNSSTKKGTNRSTNSGAKKGTLLSIVYRPAHEAYSSYTNISLAADYLSRAADACAACTRGNRRYSERRGNGCCYCRCRWPKKTVHRRKVTYDTDDIFALEPLRQPLWIRGIGDCHALRVHFVPKYGCVNDHEIDHENDHKNQNDKHGDKHANAHDDAPDNDCGIPSNIVDNLPLPPWESTHSNHASSHLQQQRENKRRKQRRHGLVIIFAMPCHSSLSQALHSGNGAESSPSSSPSSLSTPLPPPLLWKVEHPPNPSVAIDSMMVMDGRLNTSPLTSSTPLPSGNKAATSSLYSPTHVYINGYQSWSYAGSVVKGMPQPQSAMPNVFSKAFNRGGVLYSLNTDDDDDDDDDTNKSYYYKSDMFACISSDGTTTSATSGATTSKMSSNDTRVILDEEGGPALVIGFLSQRHQFGLVQTNKELSNFGLFACHEGVVAVAKKRSHDCIGNDNMNDNMNDKVNAYQTSLSTDWAYLQILDGHSYDEESLVYYIHASSLHNDARPIRRNDLIIGWCSWYHYYENIAHETLIANARVLQRHQSQLGFNVCLIDDGYMTHWGDWDSLKTDKFPRHVGGMKELADAIRHAGMKPGLWLAPYACDKGSTLARHHPDWISTNDEGRRANSSNCGKFFYGLDATRPAVRQHVYNAIRRAVREWGFEVLKLDFLYAAALAGNGKYDATVSRAEAMHLAMQTIRRAAGPDVFIIGCGCPVGSGIGFVDGMRVSCDTGPSWYPEFPLPWWDNGTLPALRGMLRNTISRSPLGHRWWHNDPDCLLLGESTKLTTNEVISATSIIGMTGGMFLLSDDMEKVSPERWSIAKRIFPLTGVTAVPLDLHSTRNQGMPSVLRLWCTSALACNANDTNDAAASDGSSFSFRHHFPLTMVNSSYRSRSCFFVAPNLGTWTIVSLSNWLDHSAKLIVPFSALVCNSCHDFEALLPRSSIDNCLDNDDDGDKGGNNGDADKLDPSSNFGQDDRTPGEQSLCGFHLFSFWSSKYTWIPHETLVNNDPLIKKLESHQTEIFHIKPANPTYPQYIGSDLHFSCGLEVRSFECNNDNNNVVSGDADQDRNVRIRLKNDFQKDGSIFVYLPGEDDTKMGNDGMNPPRVFVNGAMGRMEIIARPLIGTYRCSSSHADIGGDASNGFGDNSIYHRGRVFRIWITINASGVEEDGTVSIFW